MSDAQRLNEIRARLNAVPGPWKRATRRIWDEDVPCIVRADLAEMDAATPMTTEEWDLRDLEERGACIAQAPTEPHGRETSGFLNVEVVEAAMEFIAHSWDDIQWLLQQVEPGK